MESSFEYVFPAIRGIQSKREYYISMCPLKLITKIFLFDEEELNPELRAQRVLNKGRIPEIAEYILENPETYTFSAITASVDGDVKFVPVGNDSNDSLMGTLRISMYSRFIINDGQHRRAAIEMALKSKPELGDETISVVFFVDRGLERCQQMFADLNRYSVRPSKSLGLLYDHRDARSKLTKSIIVKSKFLRDIVELERNSLSERSRKLFTLSAIYSANTALLAGQQDLSENELIKIAAEFWDLTSSHIKEWNLVKNSKLSAGEVRRDFIHSHSIALQAIGNAGNFVIKQPKQSWPNILEKLEKINWSRSNERVWEGRSMIGGAISKASNNVTLTTNYVKQSLDIPLGPEEKRIEESYKRGKNGK
jgi:DNA sulfur modification protein DndB